MQATDQGLGFGKDVVFTFGPYHQLYASTISENLLPLVIGRLVYGSAWGAAVLSFSHFSTPAAGWMVAVFMALSGSLVNGASFYPDAPFYALQLCFLLIAASNPKPKELPLIALVYAGFVITIFCKLSFAVSAGPIVLCAAFLLARSSMLTVKQAVLVVVAAIGVPLMLWTASGQSLPTLFEYLAGPNLAIVLGYSSAMAVEDSAAAWQIIAYWIGAIGVVLFIFSASYCRVKSRFCSALICFASLFLFWTTFKAGMVRHDGHAQIAGLSLACFAILAIAYAINTKATEAQFIGAAGPLLLGLSITSQYFPPIRTQLGDWLNVELNNAYLFAKLLPSERARQKLRETRRNGFVAIRKDVERLGLIPNQSSADSMPWDITDITANGLKYRPRPIIQSYSAYTPGLQELNRKHFLGNSAPAYLVMNAQSIDGRIPPDLDYPSLEAIAASYKVIGAGSKGSLILKKNHRHDGLAKIPVWRSNRFALPRGDQAANPGKEPWTYFPRQLAEGSRFSLELKPTLWRRIQTLAFKSSPLIIAIKFDNGQTRNYRVFEKASRKIPLYPFVDGNGSLERALAALQASPVSKQDVGPKPVAIRLAGAMGVQGLQAGELIVEQPEFP